MSDSFDLFGDPVPANWGGRGRPSHIATKENSNKVNMLLALGWSNERIAGAMRITLPTLRKHYFSALKFRMVARDRLDATLAMRLWDQVEAGNVGAMREFQKLVERNDRVLAERSLSSDAPTAAEGKKVLTQRRAMDADADLMSELEQEAAAQNAVH